MDNDLQEKVIVFDKIDPVLMFGVNNKKLDLLKKHFPQLKLIARGETLKIAGPLALIAQLELRIAQMLSYAERDEDLSTDRLSALLCEKEVKNYNMDEVIVHGPSGAIIKARTVNQQRMVSELAVNDMLFAIGPAGTGKTYTAVAIAVRALKNKEVKRIVLTRPAVEAGENLGFLPGDLKEKLDPYLRPLYDALMDMIHFEKLESYLEKGVIQIAPLAFMRGRTLDHAFVILDEAQNATTSQMKMFLTRMGKSAKFAITGDMTQIDLPRGQKSGLKQAVELVEGMEGVAIVELQEVDVVRHRLVKKIVAAYKKLDNE